MKKNNFKLILLSLLIAVMTLPLAEKIFHFSVSKLAELNGAYVKPVCPHLNWRSFFNSELQDSLSLFVESEISNRNALVRLRNQIAFTLFHESPNKELVVGKNNYLFERAYIDFYTQQVWFDSTWMSKRIELLIDVTDSLKKRNIDLLVVFAPSKASFMPENIPEKYFWNRERDNIYKTCSHLMEQSKIPFIDFNKYLISQKGKSPIEAFPRGNAHWSYYTGTVAADSIARFIRRQFNIPLVHYKWYQPPATDKTNYQEGDLAVTLNLLKPFRDGGYVYPTLEITDSVNCIKPDVAIIGDSFAWTLIFSYLPQNIFSRNFEFWDYNRKVWSPYKNETINIEQLDYKIELLKKRVIIIVEGGLHYNDIGHGFIDKTYNLFHPEK